MKDDHVKVVGLILFAGLIAWVALVIYAFRTGGNDRDRLCLVLYGLVERSGATAGKKGYPGYAYYQEHPEELQTAHAQNRAFLEALPCRGPALKALGSPAER